MRFHEPSPVLLEPMGQDRLDVDHQRVALAAGLCQLLKYPGEIAQPGPAGKPVIERLDRKRILPSQPMALDPDDPAQHLAVVGSRSAQHLGKERPKSLHLSRTQPEGSLVSHAHDQREILNTLA
ncbi:hypothetical protein [Paracoccus alcaliphilus]|uniref:hypothetical protein n=1 Tax=Paracoccus alcaliphilus TaxID=34002 RepID=UPI001113D464|nr:hypothetical protein JHW40_08245 [Paracoccus alcaliphilus]